MKSVLLLTLSLLLCSYNGYLKCGPCGRSDLKGKVKRLTEYTTIGDKDAPAGIYKYEQQTYSYNRKGLLELREDSSYTYDKVSKKGVSYTYRTIYSYKRKRLDMVMLGSSDVAATNKYKYDRQKRLTEVSHNIFVDKRNHTTDRLSITGYQENGTISETENKALVDNEMRTVSRERHTYNSKNKKTATHIFDDSRKEFVKTAEFEYDSEGNITIERIYNTFNGALQYTLNYKYNKDNSLIEELKQMASGAVHITRYTYANFDPRNNYLSITVQTDERQPAITNRIIEYY